MIWQKVTEQMNEAWWQKTGRQRKIYYLGIDWVAKGK